MRPDDFSKLVIVGAPRSGTNALRDTLCGLADFQTWDCDEINYIWRYGNLFCEHDALEPGSLTESEKNYIRTEFAYLATATGARVIVEKTCANCLRLPFVNEVLPDARYLAILRSPVDAISSALQRWTGSFSSDYVIAKIRHMPSLHIPYYLTKFGLLRMRQLIEPQNALSSWGPVIPDQSARFEGLSVVEKCTQQWMECVSESLRYLESASSERVYALTYEQFVGAPSESLEAALAHFGLDYCRRELSSACEGISTASIGRGLAGLTAQEADMVLELTAPLWNQATAFCERYTN